MDKILTRHPDAGKSGVRISKVKYDAVREAILDAIRASGEITFTGLTEAVGKVLTGRFDGSVSWYVTTVKLDLEARGVIERVPKSKPQRIRLTSA